MESNSEDYYMPYHQMNNSRQLSHNHNHLQLNDSSPILENGDDEKTSYRDSQSNSGNIFGSHQNVMTQYSPMNSHGYLYNSSQTTNTSLSHKQIQNSSPSMYQNPNQQVIQDHNSVAYSNQSYPSHYNEPGRIMHTNQNGHTFIDKTQHSNFIRRQTQHNEQLLAQQQYQHYKLAQQQCNDFIRSEELHNNSERNIPTSCPPHVYNHFPQTNQVYCDGVTGRANVDYPMHTPLHPKMDNQQSAMYSSLRSAPIDSSETSGFMPAQGHIYHQNLDLPYQNQSNFLSQPTAEQFHHQNASTVFYSQEDDSSTCQNTTSSHQSGSSSYPHTDPTYFEPNTNYHQFSADNSGCMIYKSQDQRNNQQQRHYSPEKQLKSRMFPQKSQNVDNQQVVGVEKSSNESETSHKQSEDLVNLKSCASLSQEWLDTICRHLIDHMNRFGICVIDNFLGSTKGNMILNEVQKLYDSGQYTKGRLVSSKLSPKSHINDAATSSIRNDRVIWIDGCEEGCEEINNLIQTLCSVIMNSSRLALYSNKGLDKVVISKRTKAHVACYPGDGTRYIKHVDNPNGDGRVITAIYYLNKNWFSKRDGGLLRMFPVGMDEVANIEPLFDRVLFFWSDRRNPHEVLPAFRDRFAITVWYIGDSRA